MGDLDDIIRKQCTNLDTGKPYTEEEWDANDLIVAAERERNAFEDFTAEANEELRDALVHVGAQLVRLQRSTCRARGDG